VQGLATAFGNFQPNHFLPPFRLSQIGSGIATQVSVERILGFRQGDLHVAVALQLKARVRTRAAEKVAPSGMVRRKEVQMVRFKALDQKVCPRFHGGLCDTSCAHGFSSNEMLFCLLRGRSFLNLSDPSHDRM
jgi:hypothetical protein